MKAQGFILKKKSMITKLENIEDSYTFAKAPIGRGTYGIVNLATHKLTKQERAVKSILKSKIQNLGKFKEELEILRTLDHPNVVKLYEWFEDEKNFYLVMEYCSGGELFDRIKGEGQFTENEAKNIFKQIMTAVHYCHSNKIVHRDLKPENFIYETPNKNSTLKIIDFGLSKMYVEPQSGSYVVFHTIAGTPYYIAPEVLSGTYDISCDIWSCGVILYILLCGYPPFTGKNDLEVFENVKKGVFEFDEEDWKKITWEAKALITKMLSVANLRPTAAQVLKDPWLISLSDKSSGNEKLNVFNNMVAFRTASKLQKVVLTYMATQLNEEQLSKLKQTFMDLDKNKDGKLSFEELCEGFEGQYSKEELKEILSSADVDKSGFIDYTEFLASSIDENVYYQEDILFNAFNAFDLDKSGKISSKELKEKIGGDMHDYDEKIWMEMINEADLDKDGEIDFNEFMKLMYSYQKPFPIHKKK